MKIHQSFLSVLASVACVHAQDAPAVDPYVKQAPPTNTGSRPEANPNISMCYETFSVPLALAAKLQRERQADAELYARLTNPVAKDGVRQESFDIVRGLSANKVRVVGVTEEIYPTEFEAPELPNTLGIAVSSPGSATANNLSKDNPPVAKLDSLPTPATPTSFDTRNVGRSLELVAVIGGPAGPFADLVLSSSFVTLVGREGWGQGMSRAETPVFESQRVNTGITVRLDRPFLVGTMNRPPDSATDQDSAKRVWFAFVTVKAPKP